ncbi:MAG: 3'-5' exonuclease [Lamprobacter sp.]|uniref:3'-5' exonuclease n=1 Tax=Lamprobacter sp. TaxID=3100796 RepID=UPI002B25DDC8|nr:3'-5' exonuclease [Lamprobacter sp.]MEA3641570.1 3'-5' exonuclease [Lamprobacter sp.]
MRGLERPEKAALEPLLADYRAAFKQSWSDDDGLKQVRFCVLDCETTGLDPKRHRIVSIGAIGVTEGELDLGDRLEVLLRVRFNTAATLVHGITRSETQHALDESEALSALLRYLSDGVIVGHHIGHDLAMIDAALARHADDRLRNRHLDTGQLMLALLDDGAFGPEPGLEDLSLDGLCRFFGVVPHGRHTAPGDAFLTALVFLRLLRVAERSGRNTLAALLHQPTPSTPQA